jgi:hypothetical protein
MNPSSTHQEHDSLRTPVDGGGTCVLPDRVLTVDKVQLLAGRPEVDWSNGLRPSLLNFMNFHESP